MTSMGLGATPVLLELIDGARKRGLDVTTDAYPYTTPHFFNARSSMRDSRSAWASTSRTSCGPQPASASPPKASSAIASRVGSLMDGVRKTTLLPARRLERVDPETRRKERVRVGADVDIVVFDPARVIDRATFEQPTLRRNRARFGERDLCRGRVKPRGRHSARKTPQRTMSIGW